MSPEELANQFVQDCISMPPLIILGSGASIPYGIPGMPALRSHLLAAPHPTAASAAELTAWDDFKARLIHTDLETALNDIRLSDATNRYITNGEDQGVVRRLLPDSLGGFGDLLPILDTGEALVVGDASLLPSRIRIAKPKQRPDSGTIEFWDQWSSDIAKGSVQRAVDGWRKQTMVAK